MRERKIPAKVPITGLDSVWLAAGFLIVFGLGLALLAAYTFLTPPTESDRVVTQAYEHTTAYRYTVIASPTTLYPDGIFGPFAASDTDRQDPASSDTSATTQPAVPAIYTKLGGSMYLSVAYALESAGVVEGAKGQLSAVLEISTDTSGWTRKEQILAPTSFIGPRTSATLPVDLAALTSLLTTIEDETGFRPSSYTITITPTVQIAATVADEVIDESYSSPFAMTLNGTTLIPDADLFRREAKESTEVVTSINRVPMLGTSISSTRLIASLAAVLTLAVAGGIAALAYFGVGQGEKARIHARYGSMLISVTDADRQHTSHRVRVASITDLVRLARLDSGVILHEGKPGSDLYFVDQGTTSYEYEIATPTVGNGPAPRRSSQRKGSTA